LAAQKSVFDCGQPQTLATPAPAQVEVPGQVLPQLTVRGRPQLSVPENDPQFLPLAAQKSVFDCGQPQTLATPPPAQVEVPGQVLPQLAVRGRPQLSVPEKDPQFLLLAAQKSVSDCGQPQTLATPPPAQVEVPGQVLPQLAVRGRPQLSVPVTVPQFLPWAEQKSASVCGQPQTFVVPPPPQVEVPGQVFPQLIGRTTPQLSMVDSDPQFFISWPQRTASVLGRQPQTFGLPPPPHWSNLLAHMVLPQSAVRGRPQLSVPVKVPQSLPLLAQN
jgi:hypothetical protein